MVDTASCRSTRYARALATACGMTVLAIGLAANGVAAPEDDWWDIEDYDNCMKKTIRDPVKCCMDSGGIPDPTTPDEYGWPTCRAPSAETQGDQPGPRGIPPGQISDLPAVVLDPAQPPPAVVPPTVPVGPAMG